MKALLAVCFWVLNTCAFAGPVLLFTPGPPIPADHPFLIKSNQPEDFKRAQSIVLNPAAFGAGVVNVDLDGKAHTFAMHRLDKYSDQGLLLWEGEADDDSYSRRPYILLRHFLKNGELSGDIFLPPQTYLHFNGVSPTILIEMESDTGIWRGPYWLKWLVFAAILLFIGGAFAVGTALIWRRAQPARRIAICLARADATIFGGTLLLFALAVACLDFPEADWDPAHLDMRVLSGVLLFAATGACIVFWRVRAAYAEALVSISRAVREGLLGAAALLFALVAVKFLSNTFRRGWEIPFKNWQFNGGLEYYVPTYAGPGLIFISVGALAGISLWAINRYLLIPVRSQPSPQAV